MISLFPVSSKLHRSLVEEWLNEKHVAQWWGDPMVRLEQFDQTPASGHRIIACDGVPIGYVRWEQVDPMTLAQAGLSDIPEDAIDMDIFIGDASMCGLGLGPKALRLAFHHLGAFTNAPLVGLCTSVQNTRAQAAFAAAGCRQMMQYEDPEFGQCFVYAKSLKAEGT